MAFSDPFFAEVRRRHPDVDLVLLPPEAGTRAPDAGVSPADRPAEADDREVAATRARVLALADRVWARACPGSLERPAERLGTSSRAGHVQSTARATERRDRGADALDAVVADLEDLGCRVRRAAGRVARVTGRHDDLVVTATWSEPTSAFVLTVASDPLPVGGRAAGLVRAARAEVRAGGGRSR